MSVLLREDEQNAMVAFSEKMKLSQTFVTDISDKLKKLPDEQKLEHENGLKFKDLLFLEMDSDQVKSEKQGGSINSALWEFFNKDNAL